MARPGSTRRCGGLDDETRDVICTVVVDGRSFRARGTWIDRATGPVVVLALAPLTAPAVIDHDPADTLENREVH